MVVELANTEMVIAPLRNMGMVQISLFMGIDINSLECFVEGFLNLSDKVH